MKKLVFCLAIFLIFFGAATVQAQWDDLGGDGDEYCSCGYQFASACCGCGMAKPIRGYDCVNTCAPDGCCCSSQCTWEDWGACAPTSNAACQCAPPPPYCGDNSCNNGETCSTCPRDCGSCSGGGGGGFKTDPPTPTNTCSGDRGCNALANCGVNGWDNADGTCPAGQVYCKEKGEWTYGNCCDDQNWGPPGWSSCWDAARNGWTDGNGNDAYTYGAYAAARGECGSCTPNCPSTGPFCGAPDGCGGTCPSTDKGAPPAPAFTTPSASNQVIRTSTDSRFTISWNAATKAEYYGVQVYASHSPFTAPSGGTLIADSNLTSRSLVLTASHRYYAARIRALNNTCGNEYGAWSSFVYFQAAVPVTGQVFYDPTGSAHYTGLPGTLCTGSMVRLPTEAGTVSVTGSNQVGSYSDATSFTATGEFLSPYQLRLPHATYSSAGKNRVGISLSNPNWACTCPAGCNYNFTLLAPQSNVNFYVSPTADAWWQVEGGPIAAFAEVGRAISSIVPEFCIPPACSPYLIVNQNDEDSEGYALTGGGSVSNTSNLDESGHNWVARMRSAPERRQDYQHFKILALLPTNPNSDFGSGLITSLDKPDKGQDMVNGDQARAYFHQGEAVIDSPWQIDSDEKLVVMIDGDISIEDPITVDTGGFFMLVASGNITFDASLGTDDLNSPDAQVEGVFVADGILKVESTETGGDKRFIGEGTFVGWSGVKLERDYDDGAGRRALNNLSAVEYFRYRPDFITAAPEEFMRSRYSWQQVNP